MFHPRVDTKIDWFRLLVQLKDNGHSLSAIAHLTEIPKSTLNDYKQGAEPRYSQGERLLAFWMQTTGNAREQAPTFNPFAVTTATTA